jgi:hypothetical protein
LQSNAAVRTSAFPECGSGDPGDQAWGSIKYLRPFPFIQSSFPSNLPASLHPFENLRIPLIAQVHLFDWLSLRSAS